MAINISGLIDSLTFTEDTRLILPTIVVSDDDPDREISVQFWFSTPGAGMLDTGSELLPDYGLVGPAEVINPHLEGLEFVPTANWDQPLSLNYRFVADGFEQEGAITLTATAVNDAPVINAPATINGAEDTPVALTGVTFLDVDAGSSPVTVTFSVPAGAFSAVTGGGVTVGGTASAMTLVGSLADINTFVTHGGLAYIPVAESSSDVILTVSINDGGNTGGSPQSDTATITLDMSAVNDAPEITAPDGIRLPAGAATAITGLNFSDVDAGPEPVTVTLELTGVHLAALTAEGDDQVTVAGGSPLTLTGSVAAINAFIAGGNVTVSSPADITADASLVVTINDGGNTGSGGPKTAEFTIALDIGGENTPPEGGVFISGEPEVGAVLTAAADLNDPDGPGDFSYQWFANGAPIPEAEDTTLTITSDLVGKTITVAVSYTDLFGVNERVVSEGLAIPGAPDPEPEPQPTTETIFFGDVPATLEHFFGPGLTPFQNLTISPAALPPGASVVAPILQQMQALMAELSQGWGLKAVGPQNLKSGADFWSISGPTLGLEETKEDEFKRIEEAMRRMLEKVGGMDPAAGVDPRDVAVQKLTPQLLEGFKPKDPLVISGGSKPTDPLTALSIDMRLLQFTQQVQSALEIAIALQNVHFAHIQGIARIIGGAGPQVVFGDDAVQHIVLGEGDDELYGGGGDDTVGSATGNDSLSGDAGNDSVFGGEGNDQVFGGTDADTVQGNVGADLVHGNQGDDLLYGGQGDDIVRGGQGDDMTFGDLGNDLVFGDLGDDRLEGGEGTDTLQGNQGADTVLGGAGADLLYGGQGNDHLEGGEGNDTLSGDLGDDVLTGGAGADVFLLFAGAGLDRVTDFTSADHVVLAQGVAFSLRQEGADTIIDLGDEGRMILTGVQLNTLPEGWLTVA